jgi:hypothetical protein
MDSNPDLFGPTFRPHLPDLNFLTGQIQEYQNFSETHFPTLRLVHSPYLVHDVLNMDYQQKVSYLGLLGFHWPLWEV